MSNGTDTIQQENLAWRRLVDLYEEGYLLMVNQYMVASQENDPSVREVMLSNLNSTLAVGMNRGARLLQAYDAASYPDNQNRVIQIGKMYDQLNQYHDVTEQAYRNKRSDDNGYMAEILAYWPETLRDAPIWVVGPLGNWIGDQTADPARDMGEALDDAIDKAEDVGERAWKDTHETIKKTAWPLGIGLVAIAVILVMK